MTEPRTATQRRPEMTGEKPSPTGFSSQLMPHLLPLSEVKLKGPTRSVHVNGPGTFIWNIAYLDIQIQQVGQRAPFSKASVHVDIV
jgi:hypothetical protein